MTRVPMKHRFHVAAPTFVAHISEANLESLNHVYDRRLQRRAGICCSTPTDLDTASIPPQDCAPKNSDIFGKGIMARIFALLILVATVTGAIAGERFPILQPDQMNADQKKLLEALLAGRTRRQVFRRVV